MNNTICEVGLTYNPSTKIEDRPKLSSPDKAEKFLRTIWNVGTIELREEFVIVLLNNSKRVLSWATISIGGISATVVDVSAVFQVALIRNAASLILCHNHPSGRLDFSCADVNLTKRIISAGKLFNIEVDDHLILTRDSYLSYREEGI